jgi:hypothetical protein
MVLNGASNTEQNLTIPSDSETLWLHTIIIETP